ncbi:MAG: thermonuclease family protein [Azoarcus sp.]|jgi:endonuclease YncB( thermonuclease family)|nr:thermonuclease family protein [Azoarcus sp.]
MKITPPTFTSFAAHQGRAAFLGVVVRQKAEINARFFRAVLLSFALSGPAQADFVGTVVSVFDGDTIDVLVIRKPLRVRLAKIDAPEKGQPFGTRSRRALAAAVSGKTVTVRESGVDQYGRILGTILLEGRNINRMMVEEGWAWAYRQYLKDRSLLDAEATARAGVRGLWIDKKPVAPWVWRRRHRRR